MLKRFTTAEPAETRDSLLLKQQSFLQYMADQTTELQEKMEEKFPPSLKIALQSIFSRVETAHKKIATLKLDDAPLVQDLDIYRLGFIKNYFRPIITRFNVNFQFVQGEEYRQKALKKIESIFEEKDWETIKNQLSKANLEMETTFSEILSEQKKIKEDILSAEKTYNTDKHKLEILITLEDKDLGFKAELNKFISQKILIFKKAEYEQIVEEEYSGFEGSLKLLHLRRMYTKELGDKTLEESEEFLKNKNKEMQKEIEQLKKTYPDFSITLPTESEVIAKLKSIRETVESVNQPQDKKSDDVSSDTTKLINLPADKKASASNESVVIPRKIRKRKNISGRVSEVDEVSDVEKPKQSLVEYYEHKVSEEYQKSEKTPKIETLKHEIAQFYESEVDLKYNELIDIVKGSSDFPNLEVFIKDRMFDAMREKHNKIVKERDEIEAEFSGPVIKVSPSSKKSIISLVIPKSLKNFPDFEKIKNKFFGPFYLGNALWFKNEIVKFKNIDKYKEDLGQILRDEKISWEEKNASLQEKHKKINEALGIKITEFDKEYKLFKKNLTEDYKKYNFQNDKDLAAIEEKHNFKLDLTKDIIELSDLTQVKKDLSDFVNDEIVSYKNKEYQQKFDACLEEFTSKYTELTQVEKSSIDEMCQTEQDLSQKKALYTNFQDKLSSVEKAISVEIQALQKAYPGLVLTIPEKPTIDFEAKEREWITFLNKNWFNAIDKRVSSFENLTLDASVEAEIKAVEDMPLLPVPEESKTKDPEVKVESETKESKPKDSVADLKVFKKKNYSEFDTLPSELKDNFHKKKAAASQLKLKYYPNRDQVFEIIAANFNDLQRKSDILKILEAVLIQPKYDTVWEKLEASEIAKRIEKLIPYQHIVLGELAYAEYKKKINEQRNKENKKFDGDFKYTEEFRIKRSQQVCDNFGSDAKTREIKAFDGDSLSKKIKVFPDYADKHIREQQEQQEIKNEWLERIEKALKKPKQILKDSPYPPMTKIEKELKDSPYPPMTKIEKELKEENLPVLESKTNEVLKPTEPPAISLLTLGATFCAAGVGGLLYLMYHLYQQYHYQKQLVKYNVHQGFEQSSLARMNRLLKQEANVNNEASKDKTSPQTQKNLTDDQELESVPPEPEINKIVLGLSAISIFGPLVYLLYHTYENWQYNKKMSNYLDKCGMWSKSTPPANSLNAEQERAPSPPPLFPK